MKKYLIFFFFLSYISFCSQEQFQDALFDYNKQNYRSAIEKFEKLKDTKDKIQATNIYSFLVKSYIKTYDWQMVDKSIKDYFSKYKDYNKTLFLLLKLKSSFLQKNYEKAIQDGFKLLSLNISYEKDSIYYYIAQSFFELKNYNQALVLYQNILINYPKSSYKSAIGISIDFIQNIKEKDNLVKVITKTRQENIELIKQLNK